jgi:hypothetical protein
MESGSADIETTCEHVLPALIPEGDYEVVFFRVEKKEMFRARVLKALLHFKIIEPGDYLNINLLLSMNLPTNGQSRPSSKWVQHWCLAAGRRPERHDRMSTKVFRNKVFLARVKTVRTNWKNLPLPKECHYSAIDCLLEVRTGS